MDTEPKLISQLNSLTCTGVFLQQKLIALTFWKFFFCALVLEKFGCKKEGEGRRLPPPSGHYCLTYARIRTAEVRSEAGHLTSEIVIYTECSHDSFLCYELALKNCFPIIVPNIWKMLMNFVFGCVLIFLFLQNQVLEIIIGMGWVK